MFYITGKSWSRIVFCMIVIVSLHPFGVNFNIILQFGIAIILKTAGRAWAAPSSFYSSVYFNTSVIRGII